MSLRARLLNRWLRMVEKPRFRRAATADVMRRNLAFQSKLFFHAPRGTVRQRAQLGSIPALELTPRGADRDTALFYVHGGGFVFGSPDTHAALAAQLAHRIGARAVLPRYRLAPEHPFPAAVTDVRAAWDALLAQGQSPARVVIGGDSAGGALALGLLHQLCSEGKPLPAAVFAFSPLTDMTRGSESFTLNAQADVLLPAERADDMDAMFLAGQPPDDPRCSPLHGEFTGAPPVWLTVGETEILRDDSRRMAQKLEAAGVDVTFCEEHDLPHVWPLFHLMIPEAGTTLDKLAAWILSRRKHG